MVEASAEEQEAWLDSTELKTVEERNVLAVLLKFRLHPGSIDSNVFPTLKLPEDLKELIQATGLEISKVNELKKLTADRLLLTEPEAVEIRHRVGKVIVQEKLKLSEAKALVEKKLLEHGIQIKKKKTIADQVRGLKIDKLNPEELAEVRAALEQKLSELQQAMQTA